MTQPSWISSEEFPWTLKRAKVPGGEMAWLDEGEGPPVVLIHGTPSCSTEWRHLVRALAPRHRVLVPDHLGFGQSERPADEQAYTLPWHTENLRSWLEARALPRFHLVVHDFGGPIALPLAIANPERLLSLTIVQSWAWSFDDDPSFARNRGVLGSGFMRWLYLRCAFSPRVMVRLAWGRHSPLTRALRGEFLAQFPDRAARLGTWGFARSLLKEGAHLASLEEGLPALRDVPTLIVWGEADGVLKTMHLDRWIRALPEAKIARLSDVGHFPQLEAPLALAAAVSDHLG